MKDARRSNKSLSRIVRSRTIQMRTEVSVKDFLGCFSVWNRLVCDECIPMTRLKIIIFDFGKRLPDVFYDLNFLLDNMIGYFQLDDPRQT